VTITLAGLLAGWAAHVADAEALRDLAWAATGVVAAVPLVIGIVGSIRRGEWGLDVIAIIAIAGAVVLEEYLAAAIVGLMLATGQALEAYAASRAERDLSALLARAPRNAHRVDDGGIVSVPIEDVLPGDRLLVRAGEVVPVDGVLVEGGAMLDESSLTGESVPVPHEEGDRIPSGVVNAGDPFRLVAVATAEGSTYAGIVRLVRRAQAERPPVARLADRYAAGFVPFALGVAALAWIVSGDPVRALAVLVVATPCPLLLAVPISIVSGVSRAARRGVVVKGGGVLEQLADAEIIVIDKTGTLTLGQAAVMDVVPFGDADTDELLRLAASLDQVSNHVLAASLVRAARERRLRLEMPHGVTEIPAAGITGRVGDRTVTLGSADFVSQGRRVPDAMAAHRRRSTREPTLSVYVAVDDEIVGVIRLADEIRPDTPRALRLLRRQGIRKVIMATGDHPVVADAVGAAIGVDQVIAQSTPEEKVEAVRLAADEATTVMVGDGINDAPALAAADVGVAMGVRGATASTEASDVVLVVDRLDRLAEAMAIAQRSRRIAKQSAFVGMGLSAAAMGVALFGYLPPVAGALVQEGIDVIAIGSALRALVGGPPWRAGPKLPPDLSARLKEEHLYFIPRLDDIARLADGIGDRPAVEAVTRLRDLDRFLRDELLPHEQADDEEIYPILAGLLGGEDPMATMSLSHREIFRLVGVFHRLVDGLEADTLDATDLFDLRRTMYGLHAVLQLHFAQEEELYEFLDDGYHARANASSPPSEGAPAGAVPRLLDSSRRRGGDT
jgi:heavy metal translocating P-type ATPase